MPVREEMLALSSASSEMFFHVCFMVVSQFFANCWCTVSDMFNLLQQAAAERSSLI